MDILILSLICCGLNFGAIIVSYAKRMIVYSIGMFFFFALVSGQSVQLAFDLSDEHYVDYLNHYITRSGFESAQLFLMLTSIILLILPIMFSSHIRLKFVNVNCREFKLKDLFIINLLILILSFFLIFVLVGWSFFISNSRPGVVPGSTIFLVSLSIGLYPMLSQVICNKKISKANAVTFGFVLFVTLLFSRIHVIVYSMMFFVAWFYSSLAYSHRVTISEVKRLTIFGISAAIVFFGMGTIRDTLSFVDGDWYNIYNYAVENINQGILSVRYNYIASVEGMSGLAGAFTFMEQMATLNFPFDLGLNLIVQGLFQWIPSFFKPFTMPIVDFFQAGNWYPNSIVASGLESAFTSFGWLGIIIFPILFFSISNIITSLYLSAKTVNGKLFSLILIGMQVFFIRGSWPVWIGFTISYVVIFLLFSIFFLKKYEMTSL
jgi:hypothetical protein